ncbi:intracellular coagulation inhibitor 2-like [Paramacrobiotus metropolitanus]|uniref:intracellular coagulation inhibitor 2-like n=1 Tax=Paramacrobiotus metropolitanus TaxID=2943436 RepID=UPI0024460A8E|nr:intracellular coagulation inhibitor 2-like [Paramacrobiotus metropolitanus]
MSETDLFSSLSEISTCRIFNALHFQSSWRRPFSTAKTLKKTFTTADGGRVSVDTMHIILKCPCWTPEDMGGAKFLEVPFAEGFWKAIFILPGLTRRFPWMQKRQHSLEELTSLLTDVKLAEILKNMRNKVVQEVEIQMPKFRMERNIELCPILRELGLVTALDDSADFSEMAETSPFCINSVLQKVRIDVDEYGTETPPINKQLTIMDQMDNFMPYNGEFIADRPFIFLIRHRDLDYIVYMGHVADPSAS